MSTLQRIACAVLLLSATAAALTLWPEPQSISSGSAVVVLDPTFNFFVEDSTSDTVTLRYAFLRYKSITFPHTFSNSSSATSSNCKLTGLVFGVTSNDESHPQLDTDESYSLQVPECGSGSSVATANAATVYGALRALETFSQMVQYDFDTDVYLIRELPITIKDSPRFPHRGLMIDTARHFQPLTSIRAMIDSLPFAKLNVLHWHMVDDQSFPMQSFAHPNVWRGAFTPNERYTQADIASIVEYARLRGVRVMVEFDVPGHGQSWCKGYPDLCPSPTCLSPLNVARQSTFDFISSLLMEMTGGKTSQPGAPSGLFPDNFLHLGGDEVDTACWSLTPEIAKWLAARNMTADDGYAYFVRKAADIAIAQGRRPVQWSEVFDHFKDKLNKQTIVHVWKDVTNVTEVVALGYAVLRNVGYNNVSWYLDNLDVTWDAVYANEPCQDVPDSLCLLVLGGHGEMWGERVDMSDLQQTVWPKLASIAEKLWSTSAFTNAPGAIDAAKPRIQQFRCLLNARGVRAAPVNNADAREGPPQPGSCFQ